MPAVQIDSCVMCKKPVARWSLHSLTAQRGDGGSEPFILTCAKLRLKKIQSVCGEKKVVTDIFHW